MIIEESLIEIPEEMKALLAAVAMSWVQSHSFEERDFTVSCITIVTVHATVDHLRKMSKSVWFFVIVNSPFSLNITFL